MIAIKLILSVIMSIQSHSMMPVDKDVYSKYRQSGSALILSLAILTALTLAASVTMQRSTLQVRMVTNMQFKQQALNAGYSHIETMLNNLAADPNSTQGLSQLIEADQTNINNGLGSGTATVDIFSNNGWNPPALNGLHAITRIDNQVRVLQVPTGKKYSLKQSSGNSSGTQSPYYFASRVVASNATGNISSTQEQGFVVMGAAP